MNHYVKLTLLLLLVASLTGEVVWISQHSENALKPVTEKQQIRDLQKAEALLVQSKPLAALQIMKTYHREIWTHSEKGHQWLDDYIEAYKQIPRPVLLLSLYENFPESFLSHEEASLMIARIYLHAKNLAEYQHLRNQWRGHENHLSSWHVLDAIGLYLEGKASEAKKQLEGKDYQAQTRVNQLIALSTFTLNTNLKQSQEYLNKAMSLEPDNPHVIVGQAKIWEASGKTVQAYMQFLKAAHLAPDHLLMQDELAEFYLRHQRGYEAVKVWMQHPKKPQFNFILLKAFFWNRVIRPAKIDWDKIEVIKGYKAPLIEYLFNLKPDQYWDKSLFKQMPESNHYSDTLQPLFWLQFISSLKDKKYKNSEWLLKNQPFKNDAYDPALVKTLSQILSSANLNQIQEQLVQAFIDAGWDEAALYLYEGGKLPKELALKVAKAYAKNRGFEQTLTFAKKQPYSPELETFIAQLLLQHGKDKQAIPLLTKIAKQGNKASIRANWLLSLHQLYQGNLEKAQDIVESHQDLDEDVLGKEVLARIALKRGDSKAAEKIYRSIVKKSADAKSYLAEQDFHHGKFKEALEYTEELLFEYPENSILKQNLEKIRSDLEPEQEKKSSA